MSGCNVLCVVKHATEKSCPYRHVQCPFVQCIEKIVYKDLVQHLWIVHKLLQFPTHIYQDSINLGNGMFSQNYAHRPFLLLFEDHQFIIEICRKNDTGLWHFWIFFVGSLRETKEFSCRIQIKDSRGNEELFYRGPVISIDAGFSNVVKSYESLVVPDAIIKRLAQGNVLHYQMSLHQEIPQYDEPELDYFENLSLQNQPSPLPISRPEPMKNTNELVQKPRKEETLRPVPTSNSIQNKQGYGIYPDSHKVFVGNVPPDNCKQHHISEAFSKYGEIVDVFLFKNSKDKMPLSGQNILYNYGFVVFKDSNSVQKCLNDKTHTLKNGHVLLVAPKTKDSNRFKESPVLSHDGDQIYSLDNKPAGNNGYYSNGDKFNSNEIDYTQDKSTNGIKEVFVGNLPHDCTEQDLRNVFKKFGEVKLVWINSKDASGSANGTYKPFFGFVSFEHESSVKKCLEHKPLYLTTGHRINVELKR